jgi:hypothetical protein
MRQRQADKNSQLFLNSVCKFKISLFLFILVFSCSQPGNKIEGTWTYIKAIENGKEIRSSAQDRTRQIQFLENGEMELFHDNKRYGLGLYYYQLKGDSLYLTNIQVDTTGKFDTLGTSTGLLSIKNDTMSVRYRNKTLYYKREKN